jgi:hypothetical protein
MGNKQSRKNGAKGEDCKETKQNQKPPKSIKEQLQVIKKRKTDHQVELAQLEMAQVCQSLFQENREGRNRKYEL